MKVRYFATICLLVMGCPDEGRFETMTTPDAMVLPTRDAAISEPNSEEADGDLQMDVGDATLAADAVLDTDAQSIPTENDAALEAGDSMLEPDADSIDGGERPVSCTVRFSVLLPSTTVAADEVYLAGNFCGNECGEQAGDCCNWIPNDPQWSEIQTPRMDNTANFEIELNPGVDYEYKYTLGDWDLTEVGEDCQPILSGMNRLVRPDCPNGEVYNVADVVDAWGTRCP